MNNQVTLRIHQVKCIDETGGSFAERFGNDEICLGGFGINANLQATKIAPFEVNANFDDGDIKDYSPPKSFVTLTIGGANAWPKSCGVGFLLFERDNGGRFEATDKTFAELSKKLEEERTKRGLNAAAQSAALPPIPWGEIALAVWEYIGPWVKQQISSAIDDDMFSLRTVEVSIPSSNFTWSGSKVSPKSTVDFRDHSGIYRLEYDWELS
jgi:hypothetical protein